MKKKTRPATRPKAQTAADAKKPSRAKRTANRTYSFIVPVYFQFQYTFPRSDIIDPDSKSPEIKESALETLESDLEGYLGSNYPISDLKIIDDGFDCVYLGFNDD